MDYKQLHEDGGAASQWPVRIGIAVAWFSNAINGYCLCTIAGALLQLEETFELSLAQKQLLISISVLGALCGSLAGGFVADVFGRRLGLMLTGACFAAGSFLMGAATSYYAVTIGRLVIGLGTGLCGVVTPM